MLRRRREKINFGKAMTGVRRQFNKNELRAVELLAKLGATNKHIGLFFGIAEKTVDDWHKFNEPFRKAFKRGGMEADAKVAQALYRRAIGYVFFEDEYVPDKDGELVLAKRTKKRLPPDTKAAIHWLRIRQREIWSVVPEMLHLHSGKVNHLHMKLQDIPIQELTPEAQQVLFEITQKQLTEGTNT